MTLPSSGPLSISQIAAEYGVALPCVFPNDFWGKPMIAASGPLVLPGDFYGKSNVFYTPSGGTVSDFVIDPNDAQVTVSCNLPALWTFSKPANVSASRLTGTTGTSVTFTLSSLGTANFALSALSNGVAGNFTISLDVSDFS